MRVLGNDLPIEFLSVWARPVRSGLAQPNAARADRQLDPRRGRSDRSHPYDDRDRREL